MPDNSNGSEEGEEGKPSSDQPLTKGLGVRGSLPMTLRALRHKWPVTRAVRQMAINEAVAILESSTNEDRRLTAIKVLIAADNLNIKREHVGMVREGQELIAGTSLLKGLLQAGLDRTAIAHLSNESTALDCPNNTSENQTS